MREAAANRLSTLEASEEEGRERQRRRRRWQLFLPFLSLLSGLRISKPQRGERGGRTGEGRTIFRVGLFLPKCKNCPRSLTHLVRGKNVTKFETVEESTSRFKWSCRCKWSAACSPEQRRLTAVRAQLQQAEEEEERENLCVMAERGRERERERERVSPNGWFRLPLAFPSRCTARTNIRGGPMKQGLG